MILSVRGREVRGQWGECLYFLPISRTDSIILVQARMTQGIFAIFGRTDGCMSSDIAG
jgi:hypothetical protein